MSYDVIINIYTTLFGIIITVFGISVAAIIALTQILQPVLSYSQARRLVRSRSVIVAGGLMAISLIMVTLPMIGLTYEHDLLPINLESNKVLAAIWYLLVLLMLIFSTVLMTIRIFYEQSSLLIPKNALKNFRDSINIDELRSHFSYKGAVRPFPPMGKYVIKFTGDNEVESTEEAGKEYEDLEKQYKKDLAQYEAAKKAAKHSENPLAPLESYLFTHLKNGDLSAFTFTLKTFEDLIKVALNDKQTGKHIYHVVAYYSKVLERIAESAVSEGAISFLSESLESSHRLANYLIKQKQTSPINALQAYWKNTAYDSMSSLPVIFKQVMEIFRDIGESILRADEVKPRKESDIADNIHRSVGWIGEQYLEKHKPERQALMNSEHQTELDALMNTVLSFGWVYKDVRSNAYPLIYFDSLYVIGKKLIQHYSPQGEDDSYANDISNALFSLMYEYESFGEAACLAKNTEGAWIAMRGLSDFIRIYETNDYASELKKNALEAVLRLGSAAYANELTDRPDFGLESVPDYSLKLLQEHSSGVDLSHEGMEIFIKAHANIDKVKEYLRLAKPVAGTSFGLNLDND